MNPFTFDQCARCVVSDYFIRMLPAMLLMSMAIVVLAYLLGRRARKTLTPMLITEVVAEVSSGSSRGSALAASITYVGFAILTGAISIGR